MILNSLTRITLIVCAVAFSLTEQAVLDNALLTSLGYSSKSNSIQLTAKSITSISPNVFQGYKNLKALYLDSNNLTSIESSSFKGWSNFLSLSFFVNLNNRLML